MEEYTLSTVICDPWPANMIGPVHLVNDDTQETSMGEVLDR